MSSALWEPLHTVNQNRNDSLSVSRALSFRVVGGALLIGTGVCFANVYFGLQAGIVNAMPMPAALVGFAIFNTLGERLRIPFSTSENTVLQVIAGALGAMPFTSGYTGVIPALEFLATANENGPIRFTLWQMLVWSLGICLLGTAVAAPLRWLFIVQEKLRFPSGTATAVLIGILHHDEKIAARAKEVENSNSHQSNDNAQELDEGPPQASQDGSEMIDGDIGQQGIKVLTWSFFLSSVFSLGSYFLPILKNLPVFGPTAANKWLWSLDLSPAYIGYGIIIKPSTTFHMLLGAVLGWGIMSPIAKSKGWAPGRVDDWNEGSRGWIVWVSMGLIIGDSIVGLCWLTLRPLWSGISEKWTMSKYYVPTPVNSPDEQSPLIRDHLDDRPHARNYDSDMGDNWPREALVTPFMAICSTIAIFTLCFVALFILFRKIMAIFAMLFAIVIVPPASLIAIRSLGETDHASTQSISKVAQFLFGLIISSSNPNAIITTMAMAGVVEAGAWQACQQMGDLKTAYLVRTPPRAIFFGQMIGSVAGCFVGTGIYRLYTSTKVIPSAELPVPDAHLWLVAAKLIYGKGLPPQSLNFAICAIVLGAVCGVVRIAGSGQWWREHVPSGIAVAIGMYLPPALTLARALGGLIHYFSLRRLHLTELVLICSASGFILGQGIFSIFNLVLGLLGVPHL